MKTVISTLILVFGMVAGLYAQSEKAVVKSVATDNTQEVVLAFDGTVTHSEWDEKYIRVVTTVKVENFDETILKRLIMVGRYEIASEIKAGKLVLTMPKVAHFVTIKGVDLQEQLSYEVFVPKGMTVEVPEENTANTNQSLF